MLTQTHNAGQSCCLRVPFPPPPPPWVWGPRLGFCGTSGLALVGCPCSARLLRPSATPERAFQARACVGTLPNPRLPKPFLGFVSIPCCRTSGWSPRPGSRYLARPRNPSWPAKPQFSLREKSSVSTSRIRRRKHTPLVVHVFSPYLCEETYKDVCPESCTWVALGWVSLQVDARPQKRAFVWHTLNTVLNPKPIALPRKAPHSLRRASLDAGRNSPGEI